jgi:hypothetical protein
MAINYWRHVDSDHDGHNENQCLQCGERFVGHCHGWRFCPLCGTQWLGQWPLPEKQERVRAEFWRMQNAERERWANRKPHTIWVIEGREWTKWGTGPVTHKGWSVRKRLRVGEGAKVALAMLKDLRSWEREDRADDVANDTFQYGNEFRARLITE